MQPYSFSSLKYFANCPRRYNEVKILKRFKDSPFDASSLGTKIHEAFEMHISKGVPLPEWAFQYDDTMQIVREMQGEKHCELKMALTAQCAPTDYWDKSAVLRGSGDLIVVFSEEGHGTVLDWKTGKVNPDAEQLQLMSLMAFQKFPQLKTITGVLVFVEHRSLHTEYYTRDMIPDMWNLWIGKMTKVDRAIATSDFPAKPSGLCGKYCPVTNCEHNGANK